MEKSIRKKLIVLCVIMAIAMSIMPILPLRVNAAAVPVAGFGKAIKFSGASYVQIPNNTSHAITDNFTVELWFKSSSLTQKDKYLISRNGAGTYGQWGIIYGYTAKTVEFYSGSYSGADPRTGSQILINDTNWHHIAYTHNGSTGEWCGYLDGVKVFSRTSYFILPTDPVGNPGAARNLYIGGTNNTDNLAEGCIDEVRIWNEPLDAGEIDAWMYREIDSTHPDYLSLQNYYKLNDGTGTAVADTMSRADGILYGSGAIWQNSDIRSWTTNEDTAVTGYLVGSDTDGAAGLSYEIVNPGTMGTASIISGNQFRYVPNADANGSDTFTYRVTDGVNISNTQSVSITINSINDPPEVSNVQISGTALCGEVLTGSYAYNDVEDNADSSTFQWYRSNDAEGMGKTLISGATGKTYTVTSYDYGKYLSFKVTPKDALGAMGTAVESSLMEVLCKVSFNSNGGNTVSQQNISYNSMATEPDDPAQTGYTFAGWYSDIGLTTPYAFTTPVTGDITLYAKWNINSYTVSFNSNGGNAIDSQHINYNGVAAQPDNPTRIGYNFAGWCSDIELTSIYNFATPVTADITLYAKWAINNYTVSFESNGGSTIASQHINYNSVAMQPSNPSKTGYSFAGWYSDIGLTSPYDFATPVTADITLYAKWTINNYTVRFESNGGSAVTDKNAEYNTSIIAPTEPTKIGYTFSGWYNDSSLTSAYDFDTPITADITLYAKWTINNYTVSFNSSGGSTITSQHIDYNSMTIEPATPPIKTGYTFAGWYSDIDLINAYNFMTLVTADITLYAKWTINSYTVSFNSNGGSTVDLQHINYNGAAVQPDNPTRVGYTFVGWCSDVGLTSIYNFMTLVTADITLYAKWTINSYTASFESNGGSAVDSQHIDYNSTAVEPAVPPTKTGYSFAGWCSDSGLTNAYDFATPVTADITLYARWTNLGPTGTVIINGGNALTNNTLVALTLSASDPGGDTVTDMCFSDDGIQWTAWKIYAESESYTLPSGDGSKTVYVKFRDSADSIGSAASASIELDTTPPVIAGVADNTTYNVDVIPSFTEGIATLSQNGGSADIFTSGTPVSAEGSYDLEVTDAAGNTAAISFSIDKTAPSGTLSINNGEENTTSQSVSLAITSSDGNGSGQLQMRFSNDGSTWSPWEAAAADKQWTIQSAYGTATVYMQLKDRAGNISGNITDTILYRSVPVSDGSATDGVEDSNLLLSANDFAYSNPDGNLLSKIMIVSLPLHGTLKLGDTDVRVSQEIPAADLGALVFIPESNWNGTTSFAWKGSDGINYSVQEAEIIINIALVNDAPVANDGSLTTNAGTAGRGTLSATDLEGDGLSYSIEAQGSKGEAVVTDSATGAYTYTPYDGEFGSDSFTFKVNDGSADSNTATVTVNIIPSGVADLSALSVREGVLTPEFEVNTMDYFVSVSNVVNDLTVTASVYDIYSTVEIDNMSVTDTVYGEYSKIISLDVGVNTICIDVTSQDGLTTKTYTITATRAPSYNAELASVNLGIRLTPDFSPDITTYSGTVGNGVGSITLKPVAAHRTATIKVNGNTLAGSSAVVALNVGSNSIVIEVTAQDGITKKTYTFSIYRLEASNRDKEDHESGPTDSTPETIPKPAETDTGVNIYVNGKAENEGIVTTTNAGGRTTTSVVVDESKLEQNLAGEGNNAVITIPVNTNAEVVVGELNGRLIKSLENKEAVIEIKTGTATYTLPARQINIDAVSAQLGTQVALQDIKVQIEISQPAAETVKAVENMTGQNGFSIVAPPVEFNVRCTYGGRTVRVESFNAFVERSIAIPDNVDPNKITTGIIIDPDGTMRHVPTRITIVDGKYYAVINSLSNSLYSVIWHPVEFKDAAGHWAEEDIDDMGSRMIMGGAGGGKFEPDRGITRAEFTAAVVRALGLKPGMGENLFEDVKPSDWYYEYIETAYEYGIISGYGKRFGPADKITSEQAAVIIERAMRITGLNAELLDRDAKALIADFGDVEQVSAYAEYSMAACIKTGIITIKNEKLIAPKENITRAEAAVIIRRLLQKSNLI